MTAAIDKGFWNSDLQYIFYIIPQVVYFPPFTYRNGNSF